MRAALAELVGVILYLIFLQYVLAEFVFDKPDEAWVRIGWRWLGTRREVWWDMNVAATYNQFRTVDEPKPEAPE